MYRRLFGELLDYILVFLLILDTNTVYSSSSDRNFHIPEITAALLFIIILLNLLFKKINQGTFRKYGLFLGVYYPLIIVFYFMSVSSGAALSFIARFFVVLPCLVVYFCELARCGVATELFQKYTKLMTVMAAISIFFWVFGSQMHLIAPTGQVYVDWGRTNLIYPSYYGVYFERQHSTFLSFSGLRNQGIFCEGPMHSLCLVVAVAAELFLPRVRQPGHFRITFGNVHQNQKGMHINLKLLVLVVALITTVTTTGQILLIVMLIFHFLIGHKQALRVNRLLKLLIWVFAAAGGAYVAISIFVMKSISRSWMLRMDVYQAGFSAWISSPLFGRGFNNSSAVSLYSTISQGGGVSNSILVILAQGGIVLSLVYLVPIFAVAVRAIKQRNFSILLFVSVFFLEIVFTAFMYQFLMLFILAFLYGMSIAEQATKLHSLRQTAGKRRN